MLLVRISSAAKPLVSVTPAVSTNVSGCIGWDGNTSVLKVVQLEPLGRFSTTFIKLTGFKCPILISNNPSNSYRTNFHCYLAF